MKLQWYVGSGGEHNWRLVLLLASVQGFAFYDRLLVAFMAPVLRTALALSDADLGLVLGSSFALVFSAASIGLMLGDFGWERRGVLATAIVIWSLATAACGLATSFADLLSARMAMGSPRPHCRRSPCR